MLLDLYYQAHKKKVLELKNQKYFKTVGINNLK